MHSIKRDKSWSASAGVARLTAGRLRQPSRLLILAPTDTWIRHLKRLLWRLGAR